MFSSLFGSAGAGGFQQSPPRGDDLRSTARLSLKQAVEGATLKLVVEGREMTVRIPPGVNDGQKLRLKGKGRQVPGGKPGDLLLTINLEKHPIFTLRDGTNLLFDLPITVGEAVNGATVEVPLLDGSKTRMKVPAGTSSGAILRLRGRGVKAHGKRRAGDLLARVRIVVPDHPGRAIKHAAREFDDAAGIDPRAEWIEQS